jgi:hypothetical protein
MLLVAPEVKEAVIVSTGHPLLVVMVDGSAEAA